MKTQLPLSYLHTCKGELQSTLQILEEGVEKEYYLAQLFYVDEKQSCEIPLNFIIPIPSSLTTFYLGTLGKIISTRYIDLETDKLIKYVNTYLTWLDQLSFLENNDNIIIKDINAEQEVKLKKFKRGELKKLCSELAKKYNLIKGQELTKAKIDLVIIDLKNQGYIVNEKSVATVLREKLKYKKEIV